jgi:hypothetical protein
MSIYVTVKMLGNTDEHIEKAVEDSIKLAKRLDIVVRLKHYRVSIDIYPTTDKATAVKTYHEWLSAAYSDD